ncbi:alpha-glucoside-specific PTS transporter subunit IIBC [Xylocopilactobacillus apicola]|uniref:PTS alpha-glucoside transporter subunit IIBC n=1 Tax=Xylocopilactobacillus apicola TaxID=2932184 RepID=A0AAU9D6J7_9LACO|nr:alpha-glucoside-specific PTS transporter subunit IIBC [Xylocopilactobacillus apicola]BDR57905.1 PTS alpha-glucoside transporter subunit IIBC [Xylocopilactobacillus apicola]
MMQKVQRFGAAMFTPVLLFSFAGIMTAICVLMTNTALFGSLAASGTAWFGIWKTLQAGAFTVFAIIPILFVVGLPIGLANKSQGRAAMESLVIYATFNYLVNGILANFGSAFGFSNFDKIQIIPNSTNQGLTNIMGIKTLDTSIIGALIVAGITVWLHNRYFDKKLPDFLGTFQGSPYVVILGFILMIPLALITCWGWPKVQMGISSLQNFMKSSGVLGVGIYCFLQRVLIPTGLHHFIYIPFIYGPAVVPEGLQPWWFTHLSSIAASTKPLKEIAPQMGFALFGHEKVFLIPAICLAFYFTAKKSKKESTAALLIPAGLTSLLAGITEPVEFTFLFVAPPLWLVYSTLAAIMDATLYAFGVVGMFENGLIEYITQDWIPLWTNHWQTFIIEIVISLIFSGITFFVFKFMIEHFNYLTPGRETIDDDPTLISKKEFLAKNQSNISSNPYQERAEAYLSGLGGVENIVELASCATRLRVTVKDEGKLASDDTFKAAKASGVVHHGKAIQVIVGLDVPQVLETIQELINKQGADISNIDSQNSNKIFDLNNPIAKKAALIVDSAGEIQNITDVTGNKDRLTISVKNPTTVDPKDVFLSLGLDIKNIAIIGQQVEIDISDAKQIAGVINKILG